MVVYPRWRGELNIGNGFAAAASGLSPLARGTLFGGAVVPLFFRFIPAGAGNTIVCKFAAAPLAVYPRWRGEHWSKYRQHVPYHGLSPLARGTRYMETHHDVQKRFIPAGAGNTLLSVAGRMRSSLSPLARGTRADVMG
ncbi:hypothetical protein AC35_0941 [Escherichia coli 3-475-03_S3_C2]|nr:hypothetical protein AC35_0941 [Escherichia coli 3-475-03_S3_C2]CTV37293.1 Domain of uncharacterised function (DUF2825) [Escherichia coli]